MYEIIIEKVREAPELWNVEHKYYKNRKNIKNFWIKLAAQLNCSDDLLKKRWKHLKDQYRKELKKLILQNNGEVPADEDCKSPWQWFEMLSFIKAEILHNEGIRPLGKRLQRDESSTDEEDQPSRKKKRTISEIPRIEEHPADLGAIDPDYMFLMSLLPSIKSLTDIQKLQLRGKINEWLLQAFTQNQDESYESKFHITQHLTG